MEKSQVIEDCVVLLEGFKQKVDKISQMKKRIKQGDKACIEVLKQRKDMEDTIETLTKERQLIEVTMEELVKINQSEFALDLIQQ